MPQDDSLDVGQILDVARRVQAKVTGIDRSAFDGNEDLQLAVTHLIQIIGEAASRISQPMRDANPQIPWRVIVGMRQKIVPDSEQHVYGSAGMRDLVALFAPLFALPVELFGFFLCAGRNG